VRLERTVRRLFIGGLAASGACIAVGAALALAWSAPRPSAPPRLSRIVEDAAAGDPVGWLYLGLLALMALPIVRVLSVAGCFARAREWRFAVTAAGVLALLVASVALGLR
jgi:uncharacterized membrane protein